MSILRCIFNRRTKIKLEADIFLLQIVPLKTAGLTSFQTDIFYLYIKPLQFFSPADIW